ncbi:MAG TPA: non-homologous end-joining DNA ligase [Actinomycetes bacterium]
MGVAESERSMVEVDGRRLSLSNLDKVLYPETGFTKGEVVDYYVRVAPALLPHIADRPMSFQRFPDGVDTKGFFAKNAPNGTPGWVRTVRLPAPGSGMDRETLDYVVVADLPTLVWAANLAALELHVPQWTVGPRGRVREPDRLVLDLDPGPPATIVECAEVALLLEDLVAADGLQPLAKTSGSKGMQVSASIAPTSDERTSEYARQLARRLEKERPDLVVSRMAKNLRGGKVFVDWSQNNAAKTTVAPYALRARPQPWVSTPVTWDEVAACRRPQDLQFRADETLRRVEQMGDLWEPLLGKGARLP